MIEALVKSGHAYQVGGNVYFDVAKFPRYGALSGNRVQELEAGARIAVREEKKNPEDFALWKSDPHHVMKWVTSLGPDGFPGWHIECSAMARKHLGDRLDIHTGGEDNVFPHHECEIAQSESFTGKTFARYWMHSKFLQVDGGKMSKSLGNVYTLDDVRGRGFDVRVLRYALIRAQYRQPLNFTWALMEDSRAALGKLDDLVQRLRRLADEPGAAPAAAKGLGALEKARAEFEAGMNDDLNTSVALAGLFSLRDACLSGALDRDSAKLALEWLERVNQVLGVLVMEASVLDSEVEALIQARQAARKAKDFARADEIRKQLDEMGIVLEDTPKGVIWRRKAKA
jgi:cysteinyl-tRNA synthetase